MAGKKTALRAIIADYNQQYGTSQEMGHFRVQVTETYLR